MDRGFTLMEIVVVIVIMGIIAAVAMRSIDSTLGNAKVENTKHEMQQLAFAVAGNPDLFSNGMRTDFGYVGDVGALPPDLAALVSNPGGYSTWRGPYISNSFSESADDYSRDAWGALYTYSGASIQSSGGGGGSLTKPIAASASDLEANTVAGSVTDGAGNPPGDSAALVSLALRFPDGNGGYAEETQTVSSSGTFSFADMIPIGTHQLAAVYLATDDTVMSYVSVLPGGTSYAMLRFPGALWAASNPTAGSTSDIEYVDGSVVCAGSSNDEVHFDIVNNGTTTKTVSWIIATYSHTPTAYFERVRWNSGTAFNSTNPRAASGDTATFSSSKTIDPSETVTIKLQDFADVQSGAGSAVDMSNTDFSVEFSDGSVVAFNSGS